MRAISLHLTEELANMSQAMAKKLNISRTQFIRLAISHEIQRMEKSMLLNDMAQGLQQVASDASYQDLCGALDTEFGSDLMDDDNEW